MNTKLTNEQIHDYIISLLTSVKKAAPSLARASTAQKNEVLTRLSALLGEKENITAILNANAKDLEKAKAAEIPAVMLKRLSLDEAKLSKIASSLIDVAQLRDPVGSGDVWTRPNGIRISRTRVPLGVAAMIYEARPNVTIDAAALCIKTGNAVVLRGGREALETNLVLASLIRRALTDSGLDGNAVQLVGITDREGANVLMRARGLVDVLIPRGGASLIKSVVENAEVPVIETGAGNCHGYIDKASDLGMAVKLTVNAKTSNPAVCNALETLLVHKDVAETFLPMLASALAEYGVELRCDEYCHSILSGKADKLVRAADEDWATEYDDLILAVKAVADEDEAIAHIAQYSTGHSEMIVTNDRNAAEKFKTSIDSAAVYVNASTRFTDGGEFGFGAEIGISTQKLHARGPMGLDELTTVKYIIDGNGQTR